VARKGQQRIICPTCHKHCYVGAVTDASEEERYTTPLEPGSIGICLECGKWWECIEAPDVVTLYVPTDEELKAILAQIVPTDEELKAILAQMRAFIEKQVN
jgi:hypothetical protein